MGLRAVADLEDYTIAELVELIDKASTVLRQKVADSGASSSASVASFSVVEEEPEESSTAAASKDPPGDLKSPFECEYHCKFCFNRCCRPIYAHKNHACLEHRHRR